MSIFKNASETLVEPTTEIAYVHQSAKISGEV